MHEETEAPRAARDLPSGTASRALPGCHGVPGALCWTRVLPVPALPGLAWSSPLPCSLPRLLWCGLCTCSVCLRRPLEQVWMGTCPPRCKQTGLGAGQSFANTSVRRAVLPLKPGRQGEAASGQGVHASGDS